MSLLIARFAYLDVHVTSDEDAYIFQAHTFLEGRLARPLPPIPRIFDHQMIIQCNKIGWTSRYAPGHSLWLMPGALLNNPRLMVAAAAGLSLWLLAGCAVFLGAPWWSAAGFLLVSPYFLFMHGTVLSHTSALAATAAMLWGYLMWARERRTVGAVLAGLAWAFLFINRTYSAALLAVPVGVDALLDAARNHREPRVWKGVCLFAVSALAGPILFMLYNRLVTGDAMLSAYLYYHPNQRIGFGQWNSHTPALGLKHFRDNVRLLDLWLLGFRGGLPLCAVMLAIGWNRRWSLLAAASILIIILGHIPFWYPGVNTCGPFYYFETLPYFVMIWMLASIRLRDLARTGGGRVVAAILGALLAANAFAFMVREGRAIAADHKDFAELHALINSAPPHSIVAVDGVSPDFLDGRLRNPRGINGDILVVRSIGSRDLIPARYFSDRPFYLLNGNDRSQLKLMSFDDHAFQYDLIFSTTLSHVGKKQENHPDGTSQRVCLPEMGPGLMAFGQFPFLPKGRFRAVFCVVMEDVQEDKPVRIEIAADSGRRILAESVLFGAGSEHEIEFMTDDFCIVEPRIWYGGSGQVAFRAIRIEELRAANL